MSDSASFGGTVSSPTSPCTDKPLPSGSDQAPNKPDERVVIRELLGPKDDMSECADRLLAGIEKSPKTRISLTQKVSNVVTDTSDVGKAYEEYEIFLLAGVQHGFDTGVLSQSPQISPMCSRPEDSESTRIVLRWDPYSKSGINSVRTLEREVGIGGWREHCYIDIQVSSSRGPIFCEEELLLACCEKFEIPTSFLLPCLAPFRHQQDFRIYQPGLCMFRGEIRGPILRQSFLLRIPQLRTDAGAVRRKMAVGSALPDSLDWAQRPYVLYCETELRTGKTVVVTALRQDQDPVYVNLQHNLVMFNSLGMPTQRVLGVQGIFIDAFTQVWDDILGDIRRNIDNAKEALRTGKSPSGSFTWLKSLEVLARELDMHMVLLENMVEMLEAFLSFYTTAKPLATRFGIWNLIEPFTERLRLAIGQLVSYSKEAMSLKSETAR